MENIVEIEFEIEGVRDVSLLMDKWTDLPQPSNRKGWLKQAKEKAYRDKKGYLVIEDKAIKAVIREGYADDEFGKMKANKHREIIQAYLWVNPRTLSLGKKDYDEIREDVVTRKGTANKVTRVVTFRPSIKKWGCSGKINVIEKGIAIDTVRDAFQLGGLKKGLYGFRPECGRFFVTKFEVVNNGKKE